MKRHERARILQDRLKVDVESRNEYRRREKESRFHVRQKCFVAAHFARPDKRKSKSSDSSSESESTSLCEEEITDVYYGLIVEIWAVKATYRNGSELDVDVSEVLARVDWIYGLNVDRELDVVYSNQPCTDICRTVESLGCVDRLIGYMDVGSNRYFLDHNAQRIFEDADGTPSLQGVKKWKQVDTERLLSIGLE